MLALAGLGVAGSVAGCSGDGDSTATDSPTPTATEAATDTSVPTDSPTPTATATATETPTESPTPTETPTPVPEPPSGGSNIAPDDGFADVAPWLEEESENVEVNVVSEPTRAALEEAVVGSGSGPRVVVFETSGTIDLGGDWISISRDKCWIAGQTAPSPGITLTKGMLQVDANDCVVQHVRVRAGDEGAGGDPGSLDCLSTTDGTENVVIDHCSGSWSVDECMSIGYETNNTTRTNCLISEALWSSIHPKGAHSYGSLTGNNAKNVFYGGNVWSSNIARNPRLKTGVEAVVANNVMNNYRRGPRLDADTEAAIVGNAFVNPASRFRPNIDTQSEDGGIAHIEDNVADPEDSTMVGSIGETPDEPPIWPEGFEAMAGADTEEHVLQYAGARPADRTEIDQRLIEEVRNREGDHINSQTEVEGYPELEENTRELTVPAQGLRNWLAWHALAVEESDVDPPN